jgi:hypothetical protein
VERVLVRALAVDPRNRFRNAGEFWTQLSAAAADASAPEQGRLTPATTVNDEDAGRVHQTERDLTEIVDSPRTVPLPVAPAPVPATYVAAPVQNDAAWPPTPAPPPRRRSRVGCIIAVSLLVLFVLTAAAVAAVLVLAPDYVQELLNGLS